MSIGIAIIGAGMMGGDHTRRVANEIAGAHVAALVDLDTERAGRLADEIAGRGLSRPVVAASADEVIGADGVDAVIVASHDSTHADLVLASIRNGLPVLCEKPLAPTTAECAEIIEAERAHIDAGGQRLVSVGFMRRFDEGCGRLRQAIDEGDLGAALMVHCLHRNVDPYPGGSEHTITGSAVHEFDFVPWVLGEPVTEVAWMSGRSSSRTTRQDPQLLLLRTRDGVLTTLEMFVSAAYGYEVGCEVVFEEGTVSLTEPAPVLTRRSGIAGIAFPGDSLPRYAAAYRAELQAWVDSLTGAPVDPRLATASDGLHATQVADAMVEAMRNGDGRFVAVESGANAVVGSR